MSSLMELDEANVPALLQFIKTAPGEVLVQIFVDSDWSVRRITRLCGLSRDFKEQVCDKPFLWRALLLRDFDMSSIPDEIRYRPRNVAEILAFSIRQHVEMYEKSWFIDTIILDEKSTAERYRFLYKTLYDYTTLDTPIPVAARRMTRDEFLETTALTSSKIAISVRTALRSEQTKSRLLEMVYKSGFVVLSIAPIDDETVAFGKICFLTNVVDVIFKQNLFSSDALRTNLFAPCWFQLKSTPQKVMYENSVQPPIGVFVRNDYVVAWPPVQGFVPLIQKLADNRVLVDKKMVQILDPTQNSLSLAYIWSRAELRVLDGQTGGFQQFFFRSHLRSDAPVELAAAFENYLAIVVREFANVWKVIWFDTRGNGAYLDMEQFVDDKVNLLAMQRVIGGDGVAHVILVIVTEQLRGSSRAFFVEIITPPVFEPDISVIGFDFQNQQPIEMFVTKDDVSLIKGNRIETIAMNDLHGNVPKGRARHIERAKLLNFVSDFGQ